MHQILTRRISVAEFSIEETPLGFVQARWHPPTILQIYDCEPSKVLSLEHESFPLLCFFLFSSLDSLYWVSMSFFEGAKLFKRSLNKWFLVPFRHKCFSLILSWIFDLKKNDKNVSNFNFKQVFLLLYSSFSSFFFFYHSLQVVHHQSGLSQTFIEGL